MASTGRKAPAKKAAARKASSRARKPQAPRETPQEQKIREFAEEQRLVNVNWSEPDGTVITLTLGVPPRDWWEQAETGDEFRAEILRVTHQAVTTR